MNQRFRCRFIAFLGVALLVEGSPRNARADGGTVRVSEVSTGYRVTVFTSPTPWRAGPVDVSVFVQDPNTGAAIRSAGVTIEATTDEAPATIIRQKATQDAATNKLYQAAQFELPHSGRWRLMTVVVGDRGAATVNCAVDAAAALPHTSDLWWWIAWPAIPVGLFIAHQFLKHKPMVATPQESRLSNRGTVGK